MATWRLTGKHYLNVQIPDDPDNPIEWVYEETDTRSGRRIRKRYKVPLYLDPAEPSYYHVNGELYVAKEGTTPPMKGALLFDGDPTPDMDPMDDEAEAISLACKAKWTAPMGDTAFPSQGGNFGDKLLAQLSEQLAAVMNNNPLPKAAVGGVGVITAKQFAELKEQLAVVMASNAELAAQVAALQPAKRRA